MPAGLALFLLLAAPEPTEVDFGTTTARRVKLLRDDNAAVRRRAALLLAHAPADEAIAALLVALSDPSAAVREAAAQALEEMADERAVPFLAAQLEVERGQAVVVTLLLAIGRCGKSYVARRVLPFLDHPGREVRSAAAKALGRIGDAGQRDALWAALRFAPDDPTFTVRAAILLAFAELGWKDDVRKALEELEAAGARRHWEARVALLLAIGEAGITERAGWAREGLASDDPRVVAAAADALARLGERDEVVRCLGHESPVVRRAALVALAGCGDPRAAEKAMTLVREDPDVDVRFAAALVLDRAGSKEADLYLVDALRARDPVIWITALAALEKRHRRSFGRDPEAWTEFLKGK